LRVSSSNQEPAIYWGEGAQLVALNWQKFDLGMMQNEAMFRGRGGMVLKPSYIHAGEAPALYLTIDVISIWFELLTLDYWGLRITLSRGNQRRE
jgi:Phosphatidylinositol-specific phospholipase C, Y domain